MERFVTVEKITIKRQKKGEKRWRLVRISTLFSGKQQQQSEKKTLNFTNTV